MKHEIQLIRLIKLGVMKLRSSSMILASGESIEIILIIWTQAGYNYFWGFKARGQ
jgi:hypothetical protein